MLRSAPRSRRGALLIRGPAMGTGSAEQRVERCTASGTLDRGRGPALNHFRACGDIIRIVVLESPVMNSPEPAARRASSSPARRIAAAVMLSVLVFAVLWIMVFRMVTSLLIGAGCCVVIVAAGTVSDAIDMLLDALASVVFGVLAVIAAIFAAIFSLFGF
jgi:hypothetical protein